jgi:hypothetical protein
MASRTKDTRQHRDTNVYHYTSRPRRTNQLYDYIIDRLKQKYDDVPTTAYISEIAGPLAKVMVPYEGDPSRWRGAVVDHNDLQLVKSGTDMETIEVADSVTLEQVAEDLVIDLPTARLLPVLGGTYVSVFKYDGEIYYSYGRTLGRPARIPEGAVDVRKVLLEVLPVGTIDSLFDPSVDTYTTCYDFTVLDNATLDVTRAPLAVPSVIYNGTSSLDLSVQGSPHVSDPSSTVTLDNKTPYPTHRGYYNQIDSLTEKEAADWLSGRTTGAPEEVLIIYGDSLSRIQPMSANIRHIIRGDVGSIPVRITQMMSEYEEDSQGRGQFRLSGRGGREYIIEAIEGVPLKTTLERALVQALPPSRREELTQGMKKIQILENRLYDYFSRRQIRSHPLEDEYPRLHGKRGNDLVDAIWDLGTKNLYTALKWYRLI